MYNLTNLTTATTVTDLVSYSNEVTDGLLVALFITAIFGILLMAFAIKNGLPKGGLAASTICFVLSILLRNAGMINFLFVIFFAVIMAISAFYLYVRPD